MGDVLFLYIGCSMQHFDPFMIFFYKNINSDIFIFQGWQTFLLKQRVLKLGLDVCLSLLDLVSLNHNVERIKEEIKSIVHPSISQNMW